MTLDSNLVEGGVKETDLAVEALPIKPVECAWKVMSNDRKGTFRRGWEKPDREDYKCIKCPGYNLACPTYHPMPDMVDSQ